MIDEHVGRRVRAQRLMVGISQTELADAIGVSFQQVQKYEKGLNRIGAGRLSRIAAVLGVPISFFYEGAPGQAAAAPATFGETARMSNISSFLATADGMKLMTAFQEIEDVSMRQRLLALVAAISLGKKPKPKRRRQRSANLTIGSP